MAANELILCDPVQFVKKKGVFPGIVVDLCCHSGSADEYSMLKYRLAQPAGPGYGIMMQRRLRGTSKFKDRAPIQSVIIPLVPDSA